MDLHEVPMARTLVKIGQMACAGEPKIVPPVSNRGMEGWGPDHRRRHLATGRLSGHLEATDDRHPAPDRFDRGACNQGMQKWGGVVSGQTNSGRS